MISQYEITVVLNSIQKENPVHVEVAAGELDGAVHQCHLFEHKTLQHLQSQHHTTV